MKISKKKIQDMAVFVQTYGLSDYGGCKVYEFCRHFDISKTTFYQWLEENADFSNAIKEAKEIYKASLKVEATKSLFKLVQGYDYEETKTEYVAGPSGVPVIARQTKTTKHVSPNTGAVIFALTNLAPDEWKNRQSSDVTIDTKPPRIEILEEDPDEAKLLEIEQD